MPGPGRPQARRHVASGVDSKNIASVRTSEWFIHRFQVQTATQPVVPPHAVREGQVVHGSITDEEKHCLDLRYSTVYKKSRRWRGGRRDMIAHRYSTRIIAVVDFIYSVLWVIFGSYWTLIMTVAAGCGLIGA